MSHNTWTGYALKKCNTATRQGPRRMFANDRGKTQITERILSDIQCRERIKSKLEMLVPQSRSSHMQTK